MLGMGDHRLAVGRGRMMAVGTFDVCSNAAVNSDLSCFLYTLYRQTEAAVFALPGRLTGIYGYQLTAAETSVPSGPTA